MSKSTQVFSIGHTIWPLQSIERNTNHHRYSVERAGGPVMFFHFRFTHN